MKITIIKTVKIGTETPKYPNINLEKEFAKFNVGVVNGCGYIGLGENYARLRIPKEKDLEKVLLAFEYIDKL